MPQGGLGRLPGLSSCPSHSGAGVQIKKLCELQPGEKCCVVGTLFKAMPLQPSILREISEEVSQLADTCLPWDTSCGHPWDLLPWSQGIGGRGHRAISLVGCRSLGGLQPQNYLPSPNSSTTYSPSPHGANTSIRTTSWSWKMNCSASNWKAPLMCASWSQVGAGGVIICQRGTGELDGFAL